MAALKRFFATTRRLLARLLPATLFGRLALLLCVAVLASHVLALTMMSELRPPMQSGSGMEPPALSFDWELPEMAMEDAQHPPEISIWTMPGLWLDIGVRLCALVLAAWIGARWLSEPIRRLARAAKALGQDIDHPPLAEDGPLECREASQVFNQMQAQIRQQLRERDRFVAAVSHDLRTPLTRLRLRAEGLADPAQKRAFQNDVVEMDAMITATLDYLRGAAIEEPFVRLDLQSLVQSMADDQLACGHTVRITGTADPVRAQASALRRCISNLVENAIRYGGSAHIQLKDAAAEVCIEIVDPGPGLPESELEQVLAPFYRVEASRNRHHGGVGLGLSISHDIARKHRGSLQLRNGDSAGLVATLRLPRHP
ncbi:ATP-binding protein [Rhodoferax sp.]|uniref:ATP-binding protein n=1 Tax=Rhodoferax sp. TaxID=50421 RepID=UPI0025EDA8F7|nr:ATP-binding protein [Rhodoferax sp.]